MSMYTAAAVAIVCLRCCLSMHMPQVLVALTTPLNTIYYVQQPVVKLMTITGYQR
jgi:hypothetical protein